MNYIVVEQIRVSKYSPYNAIAYVLHAIRNSVSPHFGSILIINHRLPAKLLFSIAERNHTVVQMSKAFDCGIYHAQNGTIFDRKSTIIVFQPIPFVQEICLAKQFCELYGAYAVLVKPFMIANLYEVCPNERKAGG